MVGLFVFHYFNRSIIFPLRLKTKGKKMPLIIMVSAMLFNTMNGFFMGYYFGNFAEYSLEWLSDPRFILGMLVFFTGMAINWHSDHILINLRKPGETGYKIPMGGMFRWVSCPNLLGEVIEWVGFGILTWSLPGLVFAIWTFANVVPRAISHHRWYREKFPDYPKDRKAVIPGFW
jgi:steroid 5-alpha reductase family enzyme